MHRWAFEHGALCSDGLSGILDRLKTIWGQRGLTVLLLLPLRRCLLSLGRLRSGAGQSPAAARSLQIHRVAAQHPLVSLPPR